MRRAVLQLRCYVAAPIEIALPPHVIAGNFLCSAEDLSLNAFKTVLDIDLLGSFNMCKAAFDSLKQTRGVVVNISATLHYYRHHKPPLHIPSSSLRPTPSPPPHLL